MRRLLVVVVVLIPFLCTPTRGYAEGNTQPPPKVCRTVPNRECIIGWRRTFFTWRRAFFRFLRGNGPNPGGRPTRPACPPIEVCR